MPLLGFPPGAVVDGPEVWRRDAYGFAVRPQHVQRFREYAKIYKVVIYFAVLEMLCSLSVYGKVLILILGDCLLGRGGGEGAQMEGLLGQVG
jgi:hypothetical protein